MQASIHLAPYWRIYFVLKAADAPPHTANRGRCWNIVVSFYQSSESCHEEQEGYPVLVHIPYPFHPPIGALRNLSLPSRQSLLQIILQILDNRWITETVCPIQSLFIRQDNNLYDIIGYAHNHIGDLFNDVLRTEKLLRFECIYSIKPIFYQQLFRFHVLSHPQHATDCPSAFPPYGGDHLRPFLMSHRSCQESATNSSRLGFLDCYCRRVLNFFVIYQTVMHCTLFPYI